jgi:hypothetical protein
MHRPNDGVNMIGHYNPFAQKVAAFMKMPHGVGDEISDFRPTQMARARASVKVALNLALEVARDFLFGIIDCLATFHRGIQTAQPFCLFSLKLH